MKTLLLKIRLLLFATVAGLSALACQGKQEPAALSQSETPQAEAQSAEEAVAYDSTTHGALEVKCVGDPGDWFDVLQNGKRAFPGSPKRLNSTVELAPGTYIVDVNRTQREVTLAAGKKTILWTGELVAEGEPATAYWFPMQGNERRLAGNPRTLNHPVALLPGTYTVFVHVSVTVPTKSLGAAEVTAGQKTVLRN